MVTKSKWSPKYSFALLNELNNLSLMHKCSYINENSSKYIIKFNNINNATIYQKIFSVPRTKKKWCCNEQFKSLK